MKVRLLALVLRLLCVILLLALQLYIDAPPSWKTVLLWFTGRLVLATMIKVFIDFPNS